MGYKKSWVLEGRGALGAVMLGLGIVTLIIVAIAFAFGALHFALAAILWAFSFSSINIFPPAFGLVSLQFFIIGTVFSAKTIALGILCLSDRYYAYKKTAIKILIVLVFVMLLVVLFMNARRFVWTGLPIGYINFRLAQIAFSRNGQFF